MPRSTRNKIRSQIAKAADQMDIAIEHLEYAQGYARGRSEIINTKIVKLAAVLQGCKMLILQFRDEL